MHRYTAVLVLVAFLLPTSAPVVAAPAVAYEPPVPGAVWRGFDPPDQPYGRGHRGVDLAVVAGEVVRAAAGGVVAHDGPVASQRWVTIDHADGVSTSYGALEQVFVEVGATVVGGQPIGTAFGRHGAWPDAPDPGLHWSARKDGEYLDPLTLLDRPLRPTLVGPGGWWGSHPVVDAYAAYAGGSRALLFARSSPDATHRGYAMAPNHHHLVLVPGYGTEGPDPVVDPSFLGYDPGSWSAFSYAGCDPVPSGCRPRAYGGRDTDLSVEVAAGLLEQQLRALQRAQPGRPVDLVGHSMGGDVAAWYLEHLHDPSDPALPPVGHLVTIATPHRGSSTAYLVRAVGDTPIVGHLAEGLRRGVARSGVDAADRIGFGSDPLLRYGSAWGRESPVRDPQRLAELGVEVLEVAGSRDAVVSRHHAAGYGDAVVLPGGHASVTRTQALYQAIHDHLGGREVTAAGPLVGWATDEVADAALLGGVVLDLGTAVGLGKAALARNAGRFAWEGAKGLLPGPNRTLRTPPVDDVEPDELP